jgi:hypothetical protein
MGEGKKDTLRVNSDKRFKLEFHGVKVTSDAGLLVYREIDDVFGLTDIAAYELRDNRTGKNTQHSIAALLRQSVYSRLAEVLVSRLLFHEILEKIHRLKPIPIAFG